jgi:hypothetical protein
MAVFGRRFGDGNAGCQAVAKVAQFGLNDFFRQGFPTPLEDGWDSRQFWKGHDVIVLVAVCMVSSPRHLPLLQDLVRVPYRANRSTSPN